MARKRANDMGSVFRNETRGRWEAKYVAGRRPDGTLIRKSVTARTRAEVERRLRDALDARDQGLQAPDRRTTVAEFVDWWAEHVLPAEGLAPATEAWYRTVLAEYVVPEVGARTLTGPRALTPGDVESMAGQVALAGHGHRTQVAARTALGKVLRAAETRGLVARNVARIARPPRDRGKARDVKALTVPEVAALLDAIDGTPWHPVVVVGVTTGLRPGELLALHWPDVHLAGAEPHVSVRQAFTYVDGPALKAPKRDRSYRTVPLVVEAVEALKAWRKVQAAAQLAAGELWSPDWPRLVFTAADGTPRRVDVYRHALRRAVPGAHPHRLRHTYATHLLEAGTPIHHVAELLGDSVATVEATYSHVLRAKHEVADVARGLLGGLA
jgi:integrase